MHNQRYRSQYKKTKSLSRNPGLHARLALLSLHRSHTMTSLTHNSAMKMHRIMDRRWNHRRHLRLWLPWRLAAILSDFIACSTLLEFPRPWSFLSIRWSQLRGPQRPNEMMLYMPSCQTHLQPKKDKAKFLEEKKARYNNINQLS